MDLFNNEVGLNIGDEAGFFASNEELSNLVYQTHLEGNILYLNPLDFSLSPRYDINNDGVQDCLNCLNGIISLTQLIATDLP
ncbi:hypothetical protein CXF54_06000 [Olleya sp. 1-3]|nr:hypothetical protein [Olleya sp. 1-3]PKG52107.1 hypothetical protein CXF54_06000 [Olleya sp. 1-3]